LTTPPSPSLPGGSWTPAMRFARTGWKRLPACKGSHGMFFMPWVRSWKSPRHRKRAVATPKTRSSPGYLRDSKGYKSPGGAEACGPRRQPWESRTWGFSPGRGDSLRLFVPAFLSPLRGSSASPFGNPRLTPWARICRASGANRWATKERYPQSSWMGP
jgi:hypothetical protein